MPTVPASREVDDVEAWRASPRREQIMRPSAVTVRRFRDPEGSNRVGLLREIHHVAAFREMMQSDRGMHAAKADGVRIETAAFRTEV